LAEGDESDAASRERPGAPALSVVVVTHESATAMGATLPPLVEQLREGDELIVCDNASTDGTPDRVRELAPKAVVIEAGSNLGFGAACNRGAASARGDLLLFLNPDNVVAPGFRDAVELPLLERRGWSAWQGLVTAEGGRVVNSLGGVVHYTGIAWAGGAGEPIAAAPPGPELVTFPSGACLAITRDAWRRLGGFAPGYFLYHEDTELGLRLWLEGERAGIEPRARCEHDYEFDKGAGKWRHLERNRWATIIRTYPGRLLALLMPALLATELALLPAAAAGGWLGPKLRANAELLRSLPRLLRERREIQGAARVEPASFAVRLTAGLDSAYLGRAGRSRLLRRVLAAYWRLVLRLL
jgi:GT2 family glycosyltransferase